MADGSVHSGHRERMRQRYLKEGADGFADHELLEMLLYYAIPRGNTNPLAHRMIEEFGTFYALIESDPIDIARICKVSSNTAILIALQKEVSKRCIQSRWKERAVLDSVSKSASYCKTLLAFQNYEQFYVICLDSKRRFIHAAKVADGTIHQTVVHPRLVVEAAIKYQASGVILSHNHPGGGEKPSFGDITLTAKLHELLTALDIQLVDHIIVSDDKEFSFREHRLIKEESLEE